MFLLSNSGFPTYFKHNKYENEYIYSLFKSVFKSVLFVKILNDL